MSNELSGVTVLVTRPERQAARLVQLIEERGGTALRFPALAIESDIDQEEVARTIGAVSDYDIAIFISANAVEYGTPFLPPDTALPLLAAIGPSTARALNAAGFDCDVKAERGFTSEALLREPAFKDVEGKKILIFRGEGGRALLGRELERRGAAVTYAEVYKRDRPREMDPAIEEKLSAGEVAAISATSVETLVNLYELAQDRVLEQLLGAQLVTASERVVKKATALGFEHPALLADTPGDDALVDALIEWRRQISPPTMSTDETMTRQSEVAADDGGIESVGPGKTRADAPDETMTQTPDKLTENDVTESVEHRQTRVDSPGKTVSETVTTAQTTARPARGGGVLSLLAILFSLGALAVSAWLWWQQRQSAGLTEASVSMQAGLEDVQGSIGKLGDEIAALEGRLDENASRTAQLLGDSGRSESRLEDLAESVGAVNARIQGIEKSVDDIRGVSASARDNWVRAEAEYFLQAANSRLQLAQDPTAALAALQAADDRLESLGDPGLFRVRQQLAAEIEALRSVPQPDIEGIAHTLNGLARRVEDLPLINSVPQPFSSGVDEPPEGGSFWDRTRATVLGALSSMISIKRTEEDVTPLLSRDEEFFLKRNLELQLQTARLALLRGDAANYRESLRTARNWVQTHFLPDSPTVTSVITTLTELEAEEIAPQLPDISGSLRLLRLATPADSGDGA